MHKCVSKFLDSTFGNILKHHPKVFVSGGERQVSRRAADEMLAPYIVECEWEDLLTKKTTHSCTGYYKKGYSIAAVPYSASFRHFNPHLLIEETKVISISKWEYWFLHLFLPPNNHPGIIRMIRHLWRFSTSLVIYLLIITVYKFWENGKKMIESRKYSHWEDNRILKTTVIKLRLFFFPRCVCKR